MQFAFSSVAEEVTKGDNRAGFELLREDPWRGMHFTSGIRGYTAGLGRRTDWRQVSTDLLGLVTERIDAMTLPDVEGKQEQAERASVNQVVAHAWARRDLDAAIEWYTSTISQESMVESRILTLLYSLPAEERPRAARWLESNVASAPNDELVVKYAARFARQPSDDVVERLIRIPAQERDQVRILSAFATPVEQRNGQSYLRHSPEYLHRLIGAAQLSEGERERWIEVVENTPYPATS